MATKKISDLITINSVQDTDLLVVETVNGTRAANVEAVIRTVENYRPVFNFYYKTNVNTYYANEDNASSFEALMNHFDKLGDDGLSMNADCMMIIPIVNGSDYSYSFVPAQVRRITSSDSSVVQLHIYAELFDTTYIIQIVKQSNGEFSYLYMDYNPHDNLQEQYNGNFVDSINVEMTLTGNTTDSTDIEEYFSSTGYTSIVGITGVIANDSNSDYISLPFYFSGDNYCGVQILGRTLRVYHSTMYSGYTLKVTIKYI